VGRSHTPTRSPRRGYQRGWYNRTEWRSGGPGLAILRTPAPTSLVGELPGPDFVR